MQVPNILLNVLLNGSIAKKRFTWCAGSILQLWHQGKDDIHLLDQVFGCCVRMAWSLGSHSMTQSHWCGYRSNLRNSIVGRHSCTILFLSHIVSCWCNWWLPWLHRGDWDTGTWDLAHGVSEFGSGTK